MKFIKVGILILGILIISSCGGGGGTNMGVALSHATYISNNNELIGGPVAQGENGDILVYNNFARFIIKATYSVTPFPLDGMVIDADIRRLPGEKGSDIVGGIVFSPYPNHIVKVSQVIDRYPAISIADDGSLSGVPQVRVTGKDAYYPYPVSFRVGMGIKPITSSLPLQYVINYYLPGDSPCLDILTEIKNYSNEDVTIYPSLLQMPGPGKVFLGGYGFADPSKLAGTLKGIIYFSKEFNDITFGLYLGNLLDQPLGASGEVDGERGYISYAPEDGSVVVPADKNIGLVYSYCVVKGYSADLYSAIVKKEGKDNTYIEGYTCITNGNDREVSDSSGSRKVCTTKTEAKELDKAPNKMENNVDLFIFDKDGKLIAHTKSGDLSESYYTSFKTMNPAGFYSKNDYIGKYYLHLPGTYYKIWAIKEGWDLPDVSFLIVTPKANEQNITGLEADHVDFIFSMPVTLDIFSKIVPATPTPARLIVEGSNLYPLSVSALISRFGFNYDNPLTVPSEVLFIPSSGHLTLHLRKGKYKLIADKGFLFNRVERTVELNESKTILFKFIKVIDSEKLTPIDPFVENFSFGVNFDENSRDLSVESSQLEGTMFIDLNSYPVTDVTTIDAIYGSFFERDFGSFIIFPLPPGYSLPQDTFSTAKQFLKRRNYYTVVADPSNINSYFYSLGVSEELSTGQVLPTTYSNNYDFIQILPSLNFNFVLNHWFRLLQLAPDGKVDNFIFHPIIGGSYSSNPITSPPGYITTFLYSSGVSGVTPSPERCIKLSTVDKDISDALCNLVKGASIIGRYVFFSVSVTTSKGQKAIPGEVVSVINGEKIYLNLNIQSPIWAKFDTVYIFDGRQKYLVDGNPFDKAYKLRVDPSIFQVGYEKGMKRYQWRGVIKYPFSIDQNADSWIVVVVTGSKSANNYPSLKPIAISNPIFIDSDINRGYNPPCPGQFCPYSR